jgi:hypothetical protein
VDFAVKILIFAADRKQILTAKGAKIFRRDRKEDFSTARCFASQSTGSPQDDSVGW